MKFIFGVCLIALGISSVVAAQNPVVPVLRPGISVELPLSSQAVAVPAADQEDVTVVTVTAEGDLYIGTQPTNVGGLAGLRASTVYVKADARASYQQLLTVLSALKGHQLVLLTEATEEAAPGKITPPYGVSVAVGER